MAPSRQFYAVFIDIMGFAAAIEEMSDAEHDDLDALLLSPANGPGLSARAVRFASSYELFHKRLDELAWQSHLFIHTLVIFSDSAYLVTPELRIAQNFAMDMMGYCYQWQIPLRAGIGYGNFARLAFSTLSRPSGALVADSPFLGSSIVRAYRAQSCKARGFRIFLHPTVTGSEGPQWMYADLQESERSEHANRELNFLHPPYRTSEQVLAGIHDMRIGVTDPHVLEHYDASEPAIRRLNASGESHHWSFGLGVSPPKVSLREKAKKKNRSSRYMNENRGG
jgi:hypothetical protein